MDLTIFKKIIAAFIVLIAIPVVIYSSNEFRVTLSSDSFTFMEGNRAIIKVSVKNISDTQSEFMIYDVDYSTFQPLVYTMAGREAETVVDYRLKNRKLEDLIKQAKFRTILLNPGESFRIELDLKEYYKLESGKKYKVGLFFLPKVTDMLVINNYNHLYINIEKPMLAQKKANLDASSSMFSPEEIVKLFLDAEINKRWRNYVKYIDLEKYISAFPEYANQYSASSPAMKKEVLREFVEYLSKNRYDYIVDYKIENEVYSENKDAIVQVRVKRYGGGKPFIYLYKYKLENYKNYWLITDVTASVTREY